MRRIITDDIAPSNPHAYNPFGPIHRPKVNQLRLLVRRELDNAVDHISPLCEFYLQLLTPRRLWPHRTYGWLTDLHMTSGMNLFRRRSLLNPSPYHSTRIAFLDPGICWLWCSKYDAFKANPQKYVFDESFRELFNGQQPIWCQTRKQWFRDVDTLYVAHNIENMHWVALAIDLVKETVSIYDPSLTAVSHQTLLDSVRPYARMIPYLRRTMLPKDKHVKAKPYSISRVKGTPVNHKSGDCGVYTLKFIECLALGHPMKKISDDGVPFLRLKFGIEVNEWLPIPETINPLCPLPREENIDKALLISASEGLLMDL